ncbi:MAG: type II secretion system major pseudopilin GspG [Pseudomonadota bacterium]
MTAQHQRPMASSQAGFTLVEIMVVMGIIGLLATMVIINVLPSQDKAMQEKARADVATLEQAVEMFRLDQLRYPSTVEGLDVLASADVTGRPGGYIKGLPSDPWGNPYQYAAPGRFGAFDVYSLGADGREGGEGENADIGNW